MLYKNKYGIYINYIIGLLVSSDKLANPNEDLLLTLNSEFCIKVDGAMFVLSYTLVHPRILKCQIADF